MIKTFNTANIFNRVYPYILGNIFRKNNVKFTFFSSKIICRVPSRSPFPLTHLISQLKKLSVSAVRFVWPLVTSNFSTGMIDIREKKMFGKKLMCLFFSFAFQARLLRTTTGQRSLTIGREESQTTEERGRIRRGRRGIRGVAKNN